MKRKFLEELGIEKEVIDKILDENSADIGRAKSEIERVQKELETTKSTLTETTNQLNELKKSNEGNKDLQKQIETLQQSIQDKDAEIIKQRRGFIDERLLGDAKAKNNKAVMALLEAIEEEDDDKYTETRKNQIKSLLDSEDTKFLFDTNSGSKQLKGAKAGEAGGHPDGSPDLSKMSYGQIADYMKEHPDFTL